MKIAVGSDHAGFELKEVIKKYLLSKSYHIVDVGTNSSDISVDYPDFAKKVARLVTLKKVDKGVLICGSGIGMSIAANRFKKVRAAVCESFYTAKMSRLHNDANVLCLGARILSQTKAKKILDIFLSTEFEGGRHIKRIRKLFR